ncbi:MAG: hypothetical protein B6D59_03955 [Campylobacteraceae bacterium 4484_4]|nr:MAG: hypothetical protein B6D59_03955 [Campylobacteraceae bacterium 4484_4]
MPFFRDFRGLDKLKRFFDALFDLFFLFTESVDYAGSILGIGVIFSDHSVWRSDRRSEED